MVLGIVFAFGCWLPQHYTYLPAFGYNLPMRIFFERTGGFAGLRLQRILNSSELPPSEARRLHRLLQDSHFFDLPQDLESSPRGADRFHYKVTVETEQGSRTVEAGEAAVPASMRPLLRWLETRGR